MNMATATKTNRSITDAADQIGQVNERLAEAGKRAGKLYLDGYEKFVEDVTSFQQEFAEQSQNDAVKSAIATQVDTTRQMASAYTSAVRELIA
jgi:hypothetical protein